MTVPPGNSNRRCPVCMGMPMRRLTPDGALMLDYCPECNGVWFDRGEAAALRDCGPSGATWSVAREAYSMQCHGCGESMARDAQACGACARPNVVDCPVCREPMEVVTHNDLRLDVCRQCYGIWFDADELAQLWNAALRDWAATDAGGPDPRGAGGWDALMLGVDPHVPAAMAAKGFDANAAAAIAAGRGPFRVAHAHDVRRGRARGADANAPIEILGVIADILLSLLP
jgi:Zn-finger nucleic acid-binding protein